MTIDDARSLASTLPRSYEAVVRGSLKFRVGSLVYVAFSRDEPIMGFAFPKEWRDALVTTEPEKFLLPRQSDHGEDSLAAWRWSDAVTRPTWIASGRSSRLRSG